MNIVGLLGLCVGGVVVVVIVAAAFSFVRIVPEYQRLVVFRVGRVLDKPKGPGLVFLIPFFDQTSHCGLA